MADIFDQVATQEPQGDIFDKIAPEQPVPQEPSKEDIFDKIMPTSGRDMSQDEISQAPKPSFFQSALNAIQGKNTDEDQAKASNIYAISKANNLDPLYVQDNYDKLSRDPKMTGLQPDPNLAQIATMDAAPFAAAGAIEAPIATAAAIAAPTIKEAVQKGAEGLADLVTGSKPGTASTMGNDDSNTMKAVKETGNVALDSLLSVGAAGLASKGVTALTGKITDSLIDNITQTLHDQFKANPDAMNSINTAYEQAYGSKPSENDIKAAIKDKLMENGAGAKTVPELLNGLINAKTKGVQVPIQQEVLPSNGEAPQTSPNVPIRPQTSPTMPKLPETVPGPNGPISTTEAPPSGQVSQPIQGQPNVNPIPIQANANPSGGQGLPAASSPNPIQQFVADNHDQILNSYGQKYGNLVSNDLMKKEFSPVGYTGEDSVPYQSDAGKMTMEYFGNKLNQIKNQGQDVVLMTGGTGAGKSSLIDGMAGNNLVFDVNLTKPDLNSSLIQQIIDSGNKPVITFISRDPEDAYINGVLKRATDQSSSDYRRAIGVDEHLQIHDKALKTFLHLINKFPEISYKIYDNNNGYGQAKQISLAQLKKTGYSYSESKKELEDYVQSHPNLTNAQKQAFLRPLNSGTNEPKSAEAQAPERRLLGGGSQEVQGTKSQQEEVTTPKTNLSNESGQAHLPIEGLANMAKEVVATLNPRGLVPRPALDSIMTMKGQQDKTEFELEAKLSAVEKSFDKMPQADQVAFIDRIKTGLKQPTPELQAIADMMRRVEDQYWAEAKQYKPSLAYKDDHYRVLWKVIPGQAQAKGGFKGLYRKPLQGTRGFAKESTLADMSEGLAKGGVPYSYNPMTMWRNSIMDMQKFITANRMWAEMKKMGYVKFVKAGGQFPSDYVRLNDAIAKKYFPTDEGMVQAGEYFVEPNTARILNNYLGTDWLRNSAIGGSLLKLKNVSTALELSLSPFHASYVSIAAMANSTGVGLQKIWNQGIYGNPKAFLSGLSNIVFSPLAPIAYTEAGNNFIRMVGEESFLNSRAGQDFIKAFPDAKQLLEDFFTSGGKLAMHQDYKINSLKAFQEGIKNKEPWAVALSAIPAANEMIMKPLFEVYIPRLKIGAFLYEYSNELVQRSADLQSGKITRAQLARQTWTSIENRFGEMNFDNLFWDRTFKTSMQLAFRSVTWKVGALSNLAGAGPEQIAQIARDIGERRGPTLHRNMAYLLGIGMLLTLFSTLIMKTYLKQWPSSFKDLIAPRYDKDGNRIMLNTHAKDWVHIAHSPGKFVLSSVAGIWGRGVDDAKNKDFWNTDIANPDDPQWKQLTDKGAYLIGQPFSFSNYKRLSNLDTPQTLKYLNLAGVTQPAPAYVSDTSAVQMAKEIRASHFEVGGRTQEESQKSLQSYKISQQYARDKDESKLQDAVSQGIITQRKANSIKSDAGLNPLQRIVEHGGEYGSHMSFNEMAKIMKDGNPTNEEAKQILPIMTKVLQKGRQSPDIKTQMQKTLNGFEEKYKLNKSTSGDEEEEAEQQIS